MPKMGFDALKMGFGHPQLGSDPPKLDPAPIPLGKGFGDMVAHPGAPQKMEFDPPEWDLVPPNWIHPIPVGIQP